MASGGNLIDLTATRRNGLGSRCWPNSDGEGKDSDAQYVL
jgi:hypothetical protein